MTILSTRELEILRLLANGHPTPFIALRLKIKKGTVEQHRCAVYKNLAVKNAPHAVAVAFSHGLLTGKDLE